jgi:hypothetical protein
VISLPPVDACAGCAARDAVIEEQVAAIGDLLARVERLERLISRNSGNSSMPPSSDDLPGRGPPAGGPARKAGTRKPGKQPGAPGSHLAWSEQPDDTVPHFLGGTCACGAALSGAADLGVMTSHQQVEIPLAAARVIQHDLHVVACGCGKVHQAARPADVSAAWVSYGPNLQAWCVFLMVAHSIPVHRCAEMIESLTGAKPSPGFVHGMLARAAAAVADTNKLIRALIILAHVVCADETPVRPGPGRKRASSTCWSPAPACTPITCSATAPRRPSPRSCCPTWTALSSSTTATRTTTPSPA